MSSSDREQRAWQSRPVLAGLLRSGMFVVPVGVAVGVMLLTGWCMPRPAAGAGHWLWPVALLLESWAVSFVVHRAAQRWLPLAALLELSLCFPEGAPSRLKLARHTSSASELRMLLTAPDNESTQQAAERMLVLVTALGDHDRRTRGHAERVRAFTDLIATEMGMPQDERDRLKWAALLHDIGKLHVPVTLLNKPGKPDDDEWAVLRAHPEAGALIAAPLQEWLAPMDVVIEQHHERWDGGGYPAGLAGEQLNLGSRIVQVADSFEVMTAARSYKRPARKEAAMRELVRCAGSQFDPGVVRALVALPPRRLSWAMGPSAWMAALPLMGSNSATLVGTAANQLVGAAAGAALVGAATLTSLPVPLLATAPAAVTVASVVPSGGIEQPARPSAVSTAGPAGVQQAAAAQAPDVSDTPAPAPADAGPALPAPALAVVAETPTGTTPTSKALPGTTPKATTSTGSATTSRNAVPAAAAPQHTDTAHAPARTAPAAQPPKAAPAPAPTKAAPAPAPAPAPVRAAPTPPPNKAVPPPPPTKAAPPAKQAPPPPTKAAPAPKPTKAAPAPKPTKAVPAPKPPKDDDKAKP